MAKYQSKPTGNYALELGEGPVWNPIRQELSIVDIFSRRVHVFSLDGQELIPKYDFATEGDVGAALPLEDGSFLLCEDSGFFLRHADGSRTQVAKLPVKGKEFRSNDAKIGPDGRLWVGIMDYDATEGNGSLWRIGLDGSCQLLLDKLTIPNGMDWWGDQFWFVNGPAQELRCYRWDDSGLTDTGKRFRTNGTPDGLVIDKRGTIWLALWGEGRVDHFDERGEVIDSVSVASPHSTSLCFAGEGLDSLVMTSARFAMTDQALRDFAQAGDLFTCKVPDTGRQPNMTFS